MRAEDKSIFFKKAHGELSKIVKNIDVDKFDKWKALVLPYLDGHYKFRLKEINDLFLCNSITLNSHVSDTKFNQIKAILIDMSMKHNIKEIKNTAIEKLLKARENNLYFDEELSKMICGDNDKFPSRRGESLTRFFNTLGFHFNYDDDRVSYVEDVLKELSIQDIDIVIKNGLLNKKYFKEHINEKNLKIKIINTLEPEHPSSMLDVDTYHKEAQKEFLRFIEDSINEQVEFDLSSLLDSNANIDLLFENKANTKDNDLNALIEDSKNRFISNDKQVGLEKLWDAFERLKTFEGSDKKISSEQVIDKISESFDRDFIKREFDTLTKTGNSYRIRHHEKDKKDLSDKHRNYFYFRMLSLIDLFLMYYNEAKEED